MPECSVIIVNFNGKHFLGTCLDSLHKQAFQDFEAILVDNGSSDGSADFVRDGYPWVRAIRLERNAGFCVGNNIAIRQSHAEFVVLLNNDTKTEPDWLKELVRAAVGNPSVGICASRILSMTQPEVIYSAGDCYAPDGVAFRRGEGLPAAGRFEQPEEVFSACACAALYRRDMLDEIGLLDEDFFSNYEDVDLSFRARLAGYACRYVPSALVYHYGSGTAGFGNPRVEFLTSRNSEYVFFKNLPVVLLLRYLAFHLLEICWSVFHRFRNGLPLIPYLKGKLAFLLDLPRVLRKRARIQRTCVASHLEINRVVTNDVFVTKMRRIPVLGWLLDGPSPVVPGP